MSIGRIVRSRGSLIVSVAIAAVGCEPPPQPRADELWRIPGNASGLPSISADAKKIVVVTEGRLELYDVVSNAVKPLNVEGNDPAWSPDGQRIAYEREVHVYVLDLGRGVSALAGTGTQPSWSADGRSLAVRSGRGAIELIELESQRRRVMLSVYWSVVPRWSPDGAWIFYSRAAAVPFWSLEGASEPRDVIVRRLSSGREAAVGGFAKADPADFHWITNHDICQ